MADIIIAFPKIEDAKNLRRILNKNGHDVTLVCDSCLLYTSDAADD